MTDADTLTDWIRLSSIPGVGGETQRKLLSAFGMPDCVFSASHGALCAVIGQKAATLVLASTPSAEFINQALNWSACPNHAIVTLADEDYPRAFLDIPDPPILLYVMGRLELLNRPALAIVGSRSPTPQGLLNAERFAAAFAEAGLVISSGLALGVDAAAHRGALSAGGDTLAFIGTGCDRIYPARNKELAYTISEQGALVSEFPLGTPANAFNFPRRNRLISGISKGVLVVEATVESGSLITARMACEQGKDVFAIPGSIHSPQSRGCHQLIRQGAKLVETAQDVLQELSWDSSSPPAVAAADSSLALPDLLDYLGFDPCSLEDLSQRSGLPVADLGARLLSLEMDNLVAALPGGFYQRIPVS